MMRRRLSDGTVVDIPAAEIATDAAAFEAERKADEARDALADIDARTIRALREWAAGQGVQAAQDLEAEAANHRAKLPPNGR